MKVREIMTEHPQCCGLNTNLAAAAELMWKNDCAVLPVTEDGKLAGIITDRDICIALGTRNRPAAQTAVKDVATRTVQTCAPNDEVDVAMAIMSCAKVHRLPVVSDGGKLEGIVAVNDLVLACGYKQGEIGLVKVMDTLKAVSEHCQAVPPQMLKANRLRLPWRNYVLQATDALAAWSRCSK